MNTERNTSVLFLRAVSAIIPHYDWDWRFFEKKASFLRGGVRFAKVVYAVNY
jgi:hypothetical protein